MKFNDYYTVIGLARDAAPDDIKHAYRRLARKYHPDVSKEENAEMRFKEITQAYEVLRVPEKRASYDQLKTSKDAGMNFRQAYGRNTRREASKPGADEGHDLVPGDLLSLWVAQWMSGWGLAWATMRAAGPGPR